MRRSISVLLHDLSLVLPARISLAGYKCQAAPVARTVSVDPKLQERVLQWTQAVCVLICTDAKDYGIFRKAFQLFCKLLGGLASRVRVVTAWTRRLAI